MGNPQNVHVMFLPKSIYPECLITRKQSGKSRFKPFKRTAGLESLKMSMSRKTNKNNRWGDCSKWQETKELWQTSAKQRNSWSLIGLRVRGMEWERLLKIFLEQLENLGLSDNNISLILDFLAVIMRLCFIRRCFSPFGKAWWSVCSEVSSCLQFTFKRFTTYVDVDSEGVQSQPPRNAPFHHANYFELKIMDTQKMKEELFPSP